MDTVFSTRSFFFPVPFEEPWIVLINFLFSAKVLRRKEVVGSASMVEKRLKPEYIYTYDSLLDPAYLNTYVPKYSTNPKIARLLVFPVHVLELSRTKKNTLKLKLHIK